MTRDERRAKDRAKYLRKRERVLAAARERYASDPAFAARVREYGARYRAEGPRTTHASRRALPEPPQKPKVDLTAEERAERRRARGREWSRRRRLAKGIAPRVVLSEEERRHRRREQARARRQANPPPRIKDSPEWQAQWAGRHLCPTCGDRKDKKSRQCLACFEAARPAPPAAVGARPARKKNRGAKREKRTVVYLTKLQRGRCAYCRDRLAAGFHVDHIIPRAAGGSNERSNLQLACADCNIAKGAKDPVVFAQSLGRLI